MLLYPKSKIDNDTKNNHFLLKSQNIKNPKLIRSKYGKNNPKNANGHILPGSIKTEMFERNNNKAKNR